MLYTNLKTSGKLTEHLAEIEQTARKMVEQTVAQMAQNEGVTEALKATDPLRWTGLMNNLRHSAEELVLTDLIISGGRAAVGNIFKCQGDAAGADRNA